MIAHKRLTWLTMLATYLLGLTLAGCNTVEGVGRDVEAAGDAIEDAADDADD